MKKLPVLLQLYTVRDKTAVDFIGTLEQVAKLGYEGVEFAGFNDLPAPQMDKLLRDLGLTSPSAHIGLDALMGETQSVIDYACRVGCTHIAIPYLADNDRPGQPGWEKVLDGIAKFGPLLKAAGITLMYHNHDFEFVKLGDKYALDVLFESFDADLLKAQIDTYWVKYAGLVPAEYIRKYPGRVPIVHLKDMEDTPERHYTEVGSGTQDLPAIFAASEAVGAMWYVVEQDASRIDTIDSARLSRANLKALGL